MKQLILFLAMVMVSQAHAQGRQDGGEAVVVPVGSIQEAQPAVTSSGNPIYIINKNKVSGSQETSQGSTQASTLGNRQGQVQEQPVSVVQDAPLKVSPAEQMRKSRQDTEAVTEDGIVQALERARMQDEIKRRDKFNNAIQPVGTTETTATATVVTQTQVAPPVYAQQVYQPVQQVVPVQQAQPIQKIHVVEEQEEVTSDYRSDDTRRDDRRDYKNADSDKTDVKAEIRAALAEQKKPDEDRQTYYVAALASFGQYNNVVNVDKSLGYGVAVGTTFANRFVGEASFIYGSYNLNDMYLGSCGYGNCYPAQVDMRQYNFGVAGKYQILPGRFKPLIGAVLGYTRRNYAIQGQEFRTSDAGDIGALVGADLAFTENFALGVDFRYMTNLGYRQNVDGGQVVYQQANDPERLDYYTLNILAKFMF